METQRREVTSQHSALPSSFLLEDRRIIFELTEGATSILMKYRCWCGKTFTRLSRLEKHVHSTKKRYGVSSAKNTQKHPPVRRYLCEICGVLLYNKRWHEYVHSKERPHMCEVCGKGCLTASQVRQHMRTHTGKKEVCDICGNSVANLSCHKFIHLKRRPFPCNFCSKSFLSKSHLREHMRSHTGERPFKCIVCAAAFSRRDNLRTHMFTHSGKKRVHCDLCPKNYISLESLNRHKETHKNEK